MLHSASALGRAGFDRPKLSGLSQAASPITHPLNLAPGRSPLGSPTRFRASDANTAKLGAEATRRSRRQPKLLTSFRGTSVRFNRTVGDIRSSSLNLHRQMNVGGVWAFFNNGQFAYVPRGVGSLVSSSLYPIVGRYRVRRNTITFDGSRSYSYRFSGYTSVQIQGRFTRSRNGRVVARYVSETASVLAAVVNGSRFGSNSYKYIDSSVAMRRLRGNVGRLFRRR